jgi:hypothetical protein
MPAKSATEGTMARWRGALLAAGLLAVSAGPQVYAGGGGDSGVNGVKRVLLISIDGMHALDLIHCAQGVSGVNGECGRDRLSAGMHRTSVYPSPRC